MAHKIWAPAKYSPPTRIQRINGLRMDKSAPLRIQNTAIVPECIQRANASAIVQRRTSMVARGGLNDQVEKFDVLI